MTITPDQADRMKKNATDGPWFVYTEPGDVDGTYIHDDTGNMCVTIEHVGSDYRPADLELASAAPELAQTVIDQAKRIEELEAQLAGMQWEYGVEQATGTTQWFRSRPMAEAHAEARGAFRLVRKPVGTVEVVDND